MPYAVDREELVRLAEENFENLLNCAEATSKAVADHFKLGGEAFPRAATPFGGGLSRTGGPCGALSGALMGLGLLYGRDTGGDHRELDRVYAIVQDFTAEFTRRFGSTLCKGLLGCDISTRDGRLEAKKRRLFTTICPRFVRGAMEILAEIVEKEAAGGYRRG